MRSDQGNPEFSPEMPEVLAPHVIEYLFDAGPALGDQPLSSEELVCWQEGTGTALSSWEFSILRKLSRAYLESAIKFKDPKAEPPWEEAPDVQVDPSVLINRLKAAF